MSKVSAFGWRLWHNAGRLFRLAAIATLRRQARDGGMWLDLPIGSGLVELPPTGWGSKPESLALYDVLHGLEVASRDDRVAGAVLTFRGDVHGFSKAVALRRSLASFRAAGKRLVAWGESFSAEQYLIASAAEQVYLPASGALHLVGLRTEQFFLRDLLEKIDVKPELVRIGSYKSAGEMVTRDGMSPESREQIEAWQGDVFSALVDAIAEGRDLEADEVRALIDSGPYPAEAAEKVRLVDGSLYPDELDEKLLELAPREGESGDDDEPLRVEMARYAGIEAADVGWQPLLRGLPRIAYVVVDGAIRRGRGQRGVSSGAFGELFEQIERDDDTRALVLRIHSPGGDAVASDLLHRGLERIAKKKPVVISMGEVAASGGYFMAAAGQGVFAESVSLTGSIGVFGGKFNFEGLYKKLGIAKDAVEHGARAGLLSEEREFTPDERAAVKNEMQSIYEVFLDRVATGRSMTVDEVKRVAEGRIFSGARAREIGLVDELGGPLEAIRDACKRAGLGETDRFVVDLYPQRSRFAELSELLEGFA